jgi:CubicO group peptidase (beta-lactamase class C family)
VTVRALAFMVLSLCLVQPAAAQRPGERSYHDRSAMPGGVIGDRVSSLIETINANDPDAMRRFLGEECTAAFRATAPAHVHIDMYLRYCRQTGGVDFHSVRKYIPARPEETVVIVRDRNFGAWRAIILRFDNSEEPLVAGMRFADARVPSNVKEPELTEEEFLNETDELVRRICEKDVFSGAVLLARGDDILLARVCGEASKRFHIPNNIDTKFNLGSMNKMFTAVAIAQLAEKEALSYDDPISKYIDESWLPRKITDRIKIRHLLSHTSGLGDYFNATFWNGSRELYRNIEDFKPLVRGDSLSFEPGERFQYSNTGMLLAGVVIEKTAEQSYFDFIRENIYDRAGMRDSDSYEMDSPVENLAIGYSPDPASPYGWRNNLFKHVIKGGPAGGGFSTVGDLHRFARALQEGKLISSASRDSLWTDHSGAGYGYGFQIEEGPYGKVVGHSGGFDGISGALDMYIDRGYIVAVLSNYDMGASPVAARIRELIGRVLPPAVQPETPPRGRRTTR